APLAQHPSFDDFFAGASPLNLAEAEPSPNSGPAFAGWDDAPPVRQEAADSALLAQSNGVPPGPLVPAPEFAAEPAHGLGWRRVLLALIVLLLLTVGGVAWLMHLTAPNDEADRLAKAEQAYKDRDFEEAKKLFDGLAKDFPESEQ